MRFLNAGNQRAPAPARGGTAVVVAVVLGLSAACFAKGRVLLGVLGLFVPAVALAGALRLGDLVAGAPSGRADA